MKVAVIGVVVLLVIALVCGGIYVSDRNEMVTQARDRTVGLGASG